MATVFLQTGSSDTGKFLADYVKTFDAPRMSVAKKKAVKWLSDEWSVFKFGLPPWVDVVENSTLEIMWIKVDWDKHPDL